MTWSDNRRGGGGATTDTTARTLANANKARLDKIYKVSGDSVAAGEEVFVFMGDGKAINWKNPTASAITVPANPSNANMNGAGFTMLSAAASDSRIEKIYKVSGDTVPAGSEVFIITDTGAPVNYKNPTAGNLTVPATVTNTAILAAGFAPIAAKENHLHSILANSSTLAGSDTIFKVSGGKLWKNKVASPNITLTTADAAWKDNFEDAIPITALPDFFNVATVADNATLKVGEYSKAEPPANTAYHFTAPAAAIDAWFGIINTGTGTMEVLGTEIKGNGIAFWTTNTAGDAWVIAYGSDKGTVTPSTKIGSTIAALGNPDATGQLAFLTAKDGTNEPGIYQGTLPSTWDLKLAIKPQNIQTTVRDALTATDTDIPSEKAVRTLFDSINVTGEIVSPFADTFAGLAAVPADASSTVKYHTVLTKDDIGTGTALAPQYPKGIYLSGATAAAGWAFGVGLSSDVASVLDAWLSQTHADHAKQGMLSFKQVLDAIKTTDVWYSTGTFDANTVNVSPNMRYAGVSGVSTTNFPQGLAAPTAFIGSYIGSASDGLQSLYIFGSPAASRGQWYRLRTGGAWAAWSRENGDSWEFTPAPGTPGETYTVDSGNVAINDGDILTLRETVNPISVKAVPVSTWDKVPSIVLSASATTAGWAIEGSQPTSGNQAIEIVPDRLFKKWIIKSVNVPIGTAANFVDTDADHAKPMLWDAATLTAALVKPIGKGTLHDFGVATPIAVKSENHEYELHLEANGGNGYSFNTANLADGDTFRLVNTSGTDVAKGAAFTGFTSVFDFTNNGALVTGDYPVKAGDWRDIKITKNGANWYANISGGLANIPPTVKAIEFGKAVKAGDLRALTMPDTSVIYAASKTARTTGVALDAAELANWDFISQSRVYDFVPNALYMQNQQTKTANVTYQANATFTSAATFLDTDWTPLGLASGTILDYVGNTNVANRELRQTFIQGVRTYIYSTSARRTRPSFDLAEAANWNMVSQRSNNVPFVANSLALNGTQIYERGVGIWESNTTRTTGAAFDATEKANWTFIGGMKDWLHAPGTAAAITLVPATAGSPTSAEVLAFCNAQPVLTRNRLVYYTNGSGTATDEASHIWYVDGAGVVKNIKSPIGIGSALPNAATTDIFRLKGHATFPDGTYWSDGSSWAKG